MAKILIVDDEINIANVLKEYCEYNNFFADTACDGAMAVEMVKNENYDCIIMDIMMPQMDGFEAVKQIKNIKTVPIIMCSAKTEEYDKLNGFELGVDDYIVKPFSPKEVIARVKALLRRTRGFVETQNYGDLKLEIEAHKVYVQKSEIVLTNKEYELLMFLVKNRNIVSTREKILSAVWGFDYEKDERTVDTHIKMLRADLKECGAYIKTIRGVGYKFEA